MKFSKVIAVLLCCLCFQIAPAQEIDHDKIKEDLDEILRTISSVYPYLEEKNVDLNCILEHYTQEIENINTQEETILFFEYLLDEFYDNHLTLRTNVNSSYRLFAPIYVEIIQGKPIVTSVWQTQIANLEAEIIGAQILSFNGMDFDEAISHFPTHCQDKELPETREWIANKILSGRYNEPRLLGLLLSDGQQYDLDLDNIQLIQESDLLSVRTLDQIGVIRINNSLGNDNLVSAFDQALDSLWNTRGIILDLRNTVFGGDSYEARGIMSRFVSAPRPYQKHVLMAKSENNPDVERSWIEYVSPRLNTYEKPVVVLVGRWTGSMGEGLAIGFEGMERGEVVGTEMRRLAGEVFDFGFTHQWFGFKLSAARLMHVNGTPREKYVPTNYVRITSNRKDEILEAGIALIKKSTE